MLEQPESAHGFTDSLTREVRSLLWNDSFLAAVTRVMEKAGLPLHAALSAVEAAGDRRRQRVPLPAELRARFLLAIGKRDEAISQLSHLAGLSAVDSETLIEDLAPAVRVHLTETEVTTLVPLIMERNLLKAINFVRARNRVGDKNAVFFLGVVFAGSGSLPQSLPMPEIIARVMRPLQAGLRRNPILDPNVQARVAADYASEDRQAVCRLLDLYHQAGSEAGRAQVQIAVLKLAGANPQKLPDQMRDALRDYRDVLVWANQ